MPKPTINIIKGHCFQCSSDCCIKLFLCSWLSPSHQRLDLRPTVLYRRKVWRIGRQPQHFGSHTSNRLFNQARLMNWQIVQQHYLVGPQLRHQQVSHVSIKDRLIYRPLDTQSGYPASQRKRPYQRVPSALIARLACTDSLPTPSSPVEACHSQMKARFVCKNELPAVELRNPLTESLAVCCDPLGCCHTFFCEAGRAFAVPDKESRREFALWLSSSSRRPVLPELCRVVVPPSRATKSVTHYSILKDSRQREAWEQGRDHYDGAATIERQFGEQRQKYQPLHRVCLGRSRMPTRSSPVNQSSKLSCLMSGLTRRVNASAKRYSRLRIDSRSTSLSFVSSASC